MEKEKFRKEAHDLLKKVFERIGTTVDNFCNSDYMGYSYYADDNNVMDFVNALLAMEATNHSPIGCPESAKRKSKKMVANYKTSIIYNR
ncbi:hypothetical protein [Bacteroides pyogenes]|uniref:hypothetical protein n=1 Tax=Bacteroides pyogenes TaxID=310300 RepID=UPI002FD9F6D9